MVYLNVMEDSIFIEGIIASIMFPLTKFALKYTSGSNLFWYLFFAWLISWYMRKFSVALFNHIKNKYKLKTWYLKSYIPFI
jgi:hypothetical protein